MCKFFLETLIMEIAAATVTCTYFTSLCVCIRWPDIFRMKVRDKNFGIETPGETVYFKMVSELRYTCVIRVTCKVNDSFDHIIWGGGGGGGGGDCYCLFKLSQAFNV